MVGLGRSQERCCLGLSGDVVDSALKEQYRIAMTPEERNENQQAMSPNATLATEERHRDAAIALLLTESRLSPGYNTKPKWEQASADTPQRILQGGYDAQGHHRRRHRPNLGWTFARIATHCPQKSAGLGQPFLLPTPPSPWRLVPVAITRQSTSF
jgi:hypothetical protein